MGRPGQSRIRDGMEFCTGMPYQVLSRNSTRFQRKVRGGQKIRPFFLNNAALVITTVAVMKLC